MATKRFQHFSPARILLLSVIGTILLGAFILSLPICRTTYMAPVDLLFTSTAVTCVAGFLTVPIQHFTLIGQLVILIQMQIGGLGIVTLTLFLMSLFLNLNFSTQLMAGQLLDLDSWKNIKKTIFFIMGFTLSLELIGALIFFIHMYPHFPLRTSIFFSIFHSVSAFCHAGFSLFPDGFSVYKNIPSVLLPIAIIILCSSLGFLAWYEILKACKDWSIKQRFIVSLHTKLVLFITFILVSLGTIAYFLIEYNNTLISFSPMMSLVNAFFNAVCARGTGYSTTNVSFLENATLLVIMVLAFIGSSPGSPGSGIKTTTFAVFYSTIRSAIAGRSSVSLYGRKIATDQINRTLSIVALSITWITIGLFILLLTDSDKRFIDLLFELISAFSTLGLSTGITVNLSTLGKYIIIMTMVIGRVSTLAVFLALFRIPQKTEFTYPEERIMLG
jgi:trk system potassium uptake protein TrkH